MALGRTSSNVNIVLGGTLLLWGVLSLIYLLYVHQHHAACTVSSYVVNNVCYTTWYYAAAVAFTGFVLFLVGAFGRPPAAEAEDLLHTDPFTMMALVWFLSALVASVAYLLLLVINDVVYGIAPGAFQWTFGTYGRMDVTVAAVALTALSFFAAFGINLGHVRRRRRFVDGFNRALARYQGKRGPI